MWLHVPREALSASAPESEGSTSGSPQAAEWSLWCTSSGKPLLRPASWHGWRKRPWHRLLSGTTCAPSTLARGVASWISSLAGRRARISASPGSALDWMARAPASSSSTSASPSNAKPPSSSGRTSPEQLELFPASASTSTPEATEARGPSFERVTLAPLTSGPASSCWPTATVHGNDNRAGASATSGDGLQTAAVQWARENLWPTTRASDGSKGGPNQRGSAGDPMLPSAAVQWAKENLWPTASARDWKSGEASQETLERNSRPLNETATDWARSHLAKLTSPGGPECLRYDPTLHRLCLNPAFVEWLMGWSDGHTMPYASTGSAPVETESSPSRQRTPGEGSGLTCLAMDSV